MRLALLWRGPVIVLLLAGALCVAAGTILGIVNFRDVGYPDSANLIRSGELVRSGQLYPDPARPPYLLTLYGPLTYVMLAVPLALAQAAGADPQVAARLAEVGALSACVWFIYLIGRRLYGSRAMARLCVLFAVSTAPFAAWTTQIRGDLPAAAVSLMAIFLLLRSKGRAQLVRAAICAGIAVLVKQTFWAASVAMVCWLIWQRRFKDAAVGVTCWTLTVACGYGLVLWREPLALEHFAALRHPILEYRGALAILRNALLQPVALFAVVGGFVVLQKRSPERLLLLVYCLAAWLVAILTLAQAGANFNYFWEPLLSSAVLAGLGFREFQRRAKRLSPPSTAMLLLLLCGIFPLALSRDYSALRKSYREAGSYQLRRAKWESFVKLLSGHRLLSTFPDVTIHSTIPEVPDPFLNSALERRGAWSSSPVVAALDAGAYDLVVIQRGEADAPRDYRGIRIWSDAIWIAVRKAYRPACAFEGMEAWAPVQKMEAWAPERGSGDLLHELLSTGCTPLSAARRN